MVFHHWPSLLHLVQLLLCCISLRVDSTKNSECVRMFVAFILRFVLFCYTTILWCNIESWNFLCISCCISTGDSYEFLKFRCLLWKIFMGYPISTRYLICIFVSNYLRFVACLLTSTQTSDMQCLKFHTLISDWDWIVQQDQKNAPTLSQWVWLQLVHMKFSKWRIMIKKWSTCAHLQHL